MLLHFGGTSSAVDAEDIGLHGTDCCECGANFRADQHATGGFHGDLHLNRDFSTFGNHCSTTCDHRGFDLQEIHARFNQEEIGATDNESASLFDVRISKFGKSNMSKARQLGARSD